MSTLNGSGINENYGTDLLFILLTGRLVGALKSVRQVNRNEPKKLKVLRKKVVSRFVNKSESLRLSCDDKFVRDVIKAYRNYYREALLNPKKVSVFNFELSKNLKDILSAVGIKINSSLSDEGIENGKFQDSCRVDQLAS